MLRRQELFLTAARHSCAKGDFTPEVQSQVLPKFGFSGDMKGVFDMLDPPACCDAVWHVVLRGQTMWWVRSQSQPSKESHLGLIYAAVW